MKINAVGFDKHVKAYLEKRGLLKQFFKATQLIATGFFKAVDFKKRQPKSGDLYYFRINKQFRALCILDGDKLKVFDIDNHQ